ncbi:MAG: TetR/AcrR family transcriptional regulator [Candidatus Palauibacterales bacterium]|jgi:AcrR family transcriptional regulator|nr:TetR/AcrR family transcriptional regulator [Candidatus Palauibacterales bacterium]MDP2483875.1 TetR/AcrR family transcriptional regulator [Candidatus Palauibacterales bacterium]
MPVPSDTNSPSPYVREKRRKRRDEILHAALQAFRRNGYHATTLEDIARHLGVRSTALYHYFPDKESILYECHQRSLAELDRLMEEARGLDCSAERLSFLIREHVRVMTDTLDGSPLAFEVTALSEEHQQEVISARDRYERELRRTIEDGTSDGEFRPVNSKVAVFAILGAINWIARWYRPEGSLHAAEIGAGFADHLVGGLVAR